MNQCRPRRHSGKFYPCLRDRATVFHYLPSFRVWSTVFHPLLTPAFPKTRGLHVDPGTLSLISSDQPGLIIKSPDPNTTLTRVPVSPDTWYIIKNTGFQRNNPSVIPNTGPTRHTVFGPEIVKNGRVSIVTDVAVLTRKTVRMYGTWYSPAADNAGNGSGGGDSAGTVATS